MEVSVNQLIEAPEDGGIDDLNDETFGDSAENCADWEQSHEELSYMGFGGSTYARGPDEEFDFDDVLGLQETEALAQHLSELVVEEDDEDVDPIEDAYQRRHNDKKPSVDLDQLFGPHSPPGLFDVEERAMGQPNIWGSPAHDSLLLNRAGSQPFNSLLQSVLQRVPGGEMPGLPTNERINILNGAKTLEEIEHGFMGVSGMQPINLGKLPMQALTVEELERQMRGDDVSSPGIELTNVPESAGHMSVVTTNSATMNPVPVGSHPIPMPQRPYFQAPGGSGSAIRGPLNGSPSGNAPRMLQANSPSNHMWPQGMNMHMRPMGNPALQQQMMAMHNMNMRYPPFGQAHHPDFMFGPMGLNHHGFMRPPVENMHFNQHRHMGPGPMPNNAAFMNLLRSTKPPMPFPRLSMPSKTVFPLQRQQLFQQHQMMMMRQGAAARFQSNLGGAGMMPFAARQLYDPGAGVDSRGQQGGEDEYDGLMTQREKDWVIKIQLLQLHTDNPYVDDYYFTCWSLKKMLRERKQQEGIQNKNDSEPALVLPQLAKIETKAYTPAQFEGALGRLTAASIHNPRKMISFAIGTGQETDERGIEVKRFKEVLLRIEKGYDCLLDIEDSEKKALAQPQESRQSFYDERKRMITQLYRRLRWTSGESHGDKHPVDSEDELSHIISIRKGLMLVLRLLPLLDKVDSRAVVSLLLSKLATKKDWQNEVLLIVFRAISRVVESANLEELVVYAAALTSGTDVCGVTSISSDKNAINRLVLAMQSKDCSYVISVCELVANTKLGMSTTLCLINRGEVIYTTQSPLDLDVAHQNDWRLFIETTASALELCEKSSLVQPLESFQQVLAHFQRLLDKRWMLCVEDKLDTIATRIAITDTKNSVT